MKMRHIRWLQHSRSFSSRLNRLGIETIKFDWFNRSRNFEMLVSINSSTRLHSTHLHSICRQLDWIGFVNFFSPNFPLHKLKPWTRICFARSPGGKEFEFSALLMKKLALSTSYRELEEVYRDKKLKVCFPPCVLQTGLYGFKWVSQSASHATWRT